MTVVAKRQGRTRAVGAGASLVLHVVVLSWLGLRAVQPSRPEPPPEAAPLQVELVRPPPTRAAPAARVPRATPTALRQAVVLPRPRPAAPVAPQLAPKRLPMPPIPSTGTARGAPAAASGGGEQIGARPAPGPAPGSEMQSDLRGFLRGAVGCSHEEYLRLTPVERARCDSGFATAARTAPSIPLPDDKLAEYARGADANARKRARREGPLYQPFVACDSSKPGGNLGLGCLAPDAVHTVGKF